MIAISAGRDPATASIRCYRGTDDPGIETIADQQMLARVIAELAVQLVRISSASRASGFNSWGENQAEVLKTVDW